MKGVVGEVGAVALAVTVKNDLFRYASEYQSITAVEYTLILGALHRMQPRLNRLRQRHPTDLDVHPIPSITTAKSRCQMTLCYASPHKRAPMFERERDDVLDMPLHPIGYSLSARSGLWYKPKNATPPLFGQRSESKQRGATFKMVKKQVNWVRLGMVNSILRAMVRRWPCMVEIAGQHALRSFHCTHSPTTSISV